MPSLPRSWILVVSSLTVLTGALFVAATALERGAATHAVTVQAHTEANEGSGEAEEHSAAESQEHGKNPGTFEASEGRFLGLNLEAPWVVWAVIAETVVVALALILFGRPMLFVVIVFSIAGTALDTRELVHQMAASRALVAALVSVTAASRIAAAVVSVLAIVVSFRSGIRRSA